MSVNEFYNYANFVKAKIEEENNKLLKYNGTKAIK